MITARQCIHASSKALCEYFLSEIKVRQKMKCMFDTNALNRIIKQKIDATYFDKNHEYFITPVQYSEILQTNDTYVREKLLKGLEIIRDFAPMGQVNIHSAPWGHFPWGHGPWGGGDGKYYNQIFNKLLECSGNKSRRGDYSDALIIETCKMEGMTLITNDSSVQKVCTDFKVNWLTLGAFLSSLGVENEAKPVNIHISRDNA